jgi:membrane fusion protein, multidrug efflux system
MTDEVSVMSSKHACSLAALFVASLSLLVSGCGDTAAQVPPAAPGVVVELAAVAEAGVPAPIVSQGTLARRDEARLAFKIGGVLEDVKVRAGDRVVAGQILARLNGGEIDAEVARAESLREEARRGMERAERLAREGVVSIERAEDARTAYETATAGVEIARFNRRFSVIEAPADGWVLERLAEPGELLASGRPVLRFAPASGGWVVRAAVADRVADRLRVGGGARVIDSFGREFPAKLDRIEGAAQDGTRLAKLEWLIEGAAPDEWRSGAVVELKMEVQRQVGTVRIPAAAVVAADAQEVEVFRAEPLEGGQLKVRRERLSMSRIEGDSILATGPIAVGDRVVTSGASWLKDGDVALSSERRVP